MIAEKKREQRTLSFKTAEETRLIADAVIIYHDWIGKMINELPEIAPDQRMHTISEYEKMAAHCKEMHEAIEKISTPDDAGDAREVTSPYPSRET